MKPTPIAPSTPGGFLFVTKSATCSLTSGTRVRVVTPRDVLDVPFRGRTGTLLGYSLSHGYAIVRMDTVSGAMNGEHLFHPEALERIP